MHMRTMRLMAALALLSFIMFLAPVFAQAYGGNDPTIRAPPILGTTGAPALTSPQLFSGAISALYANGRPVILGSAQVNLELCSGSGCVTIPTTLTFVAPGQYTYSISPPSLTGTVIIYVQADTLIDLYGRAFPSVITQIGTYSAPTSSSSTSATAGAQPTVDSTRQASNIASSSPKLMREAPPLTQESTQSPIMEVLLALSVLILSAVSLLFLPSYLLKR